MNVANNPMDYYARSKLGIAFAGLGEKQLAIESGQKALEIGTENYSDMQALIWTDRVAIQGSGLGETSSTPCSTVDSSCSLCSACFFQPSAQNKAQIDP